MLNPSVLSDSIPAITIWRKYYYAGANRVAMQVSGDPIASQNGVFYLLSDHLGSSSVTVKATDEVLTKVAELRYKPWGENRYSGYSETATPTDRRFTGQRLEQELGIYHYGARWYDPMTGRFLSPDTIVPEKIQGVQAWDRYAYANNNPVRYNDPTGHRVDDGCGTEGCQVRGTPPPLPIKPKLTPEPSSPEFSLETPVPTMPFYYYSQAPTSTPAQPMNQSSLQIHIQSDLANVDWTDAGIDIFGLATNTGNVIATSLGAPEFGILIDAVGDVVEVGGFIKAGYDLAQGDIQNLQLQVATDRAIQVALIAKAERAVPYIGFIGNLTSLWLNFKPQISIEIK